MSNISQQFKNAVQAAFRKSGQESAEVHTILPERKQSHSKPRYVDPLCLIVAMRASRQFPRATIMSVIRSGCKVGKGVRLQLLEIPSLPHVAKVV